MTEPAFDRLPEAAAQAMASLWEGHQRFRSGRPQATRYQAEDLKHLSEHPHPIAAVVTCSDARVAPEAIFDQPLGALFVSRVPGNVASDGTKWMLEIAVSDLKVPLVVVLGHTRCLAVGQMLENRIGGAGGTLRFDVMKAVHRAKQSNAPDVFRAAVRENAALTIENLHRESFATQKALERREIGLAGAVYDVDTGTIEWLAIS